jgi:2-phospho-L-lactate guanylyltransferase
VDAHVLVPLKAIDPKSRLAGALSPAERAGLMRELLDRVVGAVREAGVERVTVVTGRPIDGYDVWVDGGLAWNEAMRAVVRRPVAAVISADLPDLRADEVEALLEATPAHGIAIARARDGGTNAVAMRPPGVVRTCFGERGSAAVHAGLGVPHVMVDLPGLAFDVDTPADLARMRAACR